MNQSSSSYVRGFGLIAYLRQGRSRLRGFGLIEVLIAGSILALVVGANAGLYTAIRKGVTRSQSGVSAADLLNEGAEMIRNMRDTALLDEVPTNHWSSYLDIDIAGNPVAADSDYRIITSATGQFRLEPGRETLVRNGASFTRSVRFQTIPAIGGGFATSPQSTARYMMVRVTPPEGRVIELSFLLTDWRP